MTMGITSPTSTTGQILKNGSAVISFDANNNATFAGNVAPTVNSTFRNRIINGAMVIDQRNAGASINPTDGQFSVDRFVIFRSQASKLTAQQNAGSVTPPAGFSNYLGITSSSSYSVVAGDYFLVSQRIEGYNMADLAWGTANAKTITLSFWVRSSLTGTFGGSLQNASQNRAYPFTYTISSANTWTQVSVTIPGCTDGTWSTTNSEGIGLYFGLGVGSTYSGTAGSWVLNTSLFSATGATSVVGTNGATLYITGVQLEVGSVATPFEQRLYGTEFALCQRYYQQYASTGDSGGYLCNAYNDTTVRAFGVIQFPVIMRTPPTLTIISGTAWGLYAVPANTLPCTSITLLSISSMPSSIALIFTVASGLTAGQGTVVKDAGTSTSGRIQLSAEL